MTPREWKFQRIVEASRKKPDEHRWLEAVNVSDKLKNQPGALRLAYALFDAYRAELGYAYPSREFLALKLSSHEHAISEWTSKLREVGALQTAMQGTLHGELQHSNDPRSLIFILNMDWADDVLTARAERKGMLGTRPKRSVVKSTTGHVVKSTTEIGPEDHDTNNLSRSPTDHPEQEGAEVSESSVYEKSLGPELPLDAPETREEAWEWLKRAGLARDEALPLLPQLLAGRLFRSTIDQALMRRKRHEQAA